MDVTRPEFLPDPGLVRTDMEALQDRIRQAARFDPSTQCCPETLEHARIAGIDQAFTDDSVVSAIVVMQGEEIIETSIARRPIECPYIPGLLSFREAGAAIDAAADLSERPDICMVDGNGRLHYREAGLATHLGVVLDVPAIGVAKRLLCGRLADSPTRPYPVGTRVAIIADNQVTAERDTLLGYAVQTRQWDHPDRHINPLYVSPGHRIDAESAASVVLSTAHSYKLPEPIRQADHAASVAATDVDR